MHKLNDDEFEKLIRNIADGQSPSDLYRQWTGYLRGAETLREKQAELLSSGKADEAQELTRAILQAERMAKAIEATDKFIEYRKRYGL